MDLDVGIGDPPGSPRLDPATGDDQPPFGGAGHELDASLARARHRGKAARPLGGRRQPLLAQEDGPHRYLLKYIGWGPSRAPPVRPAPVLRSRRSLRGVAMGTSRLERVAPLTGVAFAVVLAVGFLTAGDVPDTDASGAEVISHYDDSGEVLLGVLALLLCGVLFLFFAGVLRARLRESGPEWLASVAFGGAVTFAVGLGIFAMSQFALLDASDLEQPEVAQALNIIDNDNFAPAVIGLAVVLLATAWHVLASRSLPVWVGWVSLVLGVLAVAGPLGFFAFLLFPLWVAAVAVVLFLGSRADAVGARDGSVAPLPG